MALWFGFPKDDEDGAQPAATAQRLDGVRFEFRVASSAWLTRDRWAKKDRMLVIDILRWDKDRAWTDWGGHVKKDLAGRLQSACPSLRLTERKRLAKKIAAGGVMSIRVENPKYAESLSHILEATGAVVSMKEEPNQ